MKYEEVKEYYENGQLNYHFLLDENGLTYGEFRKYYHNGQLCWHRFHRNHSPYGEMKEFNSDGTICYHYLIDVEYDKLASVTYDGEPDCHTEEELIQIAKEHGLPLLSELPKTEEEVTLWNLKYPDLPLLSITTE